MLPVGMQLPIVLASVAANHKITDVQLWPERGVTRNSNVNQPTVGWMVRKCSTMLFWDRPSKVTIHHNLSD